MSDIFSRIVSFSASKEAGDIAAKKAAPVLDRPSSEIAPPTPRGLSEENKSYRPSVARPTAPPPTSSIQFESDTQDVPGPGQSIDSNQGDPIGFSAVTPNVTGQMEDVLGNTVRAVGSKVGFGIPDTNYTKEMIDNVFGMTPEYNRATGQMSTSLPNVGLLGASSVMGLAMSAISSRMRSVQTQAALNAAAGIPNNGLVSVNGQVVAIKDNNLYGIVPEDETYLGFKRKVISYMNTLTQDERAGGYGKMGTMQNPNQVKMATMDIEGRFSDAGKTGQDGGDSGGRDTTGFGRDREDRERGFGGGSSPFAKGGRVHMANGDLAIPVGEAGFVDGPPENFSKEQTVADSEKGKVQKDSFVINAPAVEVAGSDDIRKMILEAYNTAKEKGLDIDNIDPTLYEESVDVALSKGEVVVPPVLVKIIGLDRLRKINNRGKKEVDNRQQNMRKGGFIEGYATGDLVSDIGEEIPYDTRMTLPKSTERKFKKFLNSKKSRGSVEKFIDSMTDVERLAVLGLAETTANKDSVESMMAVGQVALNRAASNRPDFKNVNDLKSVMKQRSNRGTGSKMFQYDGLEPTKLRERIKEVVDGTSPRGVSKVLAAAENLTNPEYEFDPILPFDVMFYTAPNAPLAKAMESNPMMQYYTSLGGHDYYSLLAAPESP